MLIETFVTQPTVEGLDESVLHWFACFDIVPVDTTAGPSQYCCAGQLRAIITNDYLGYFPLTYQPFQFLHDSCPAERGIDYRSQAFPAEVIHDAQDAIAPS